MDYWCEAETFATEVLIKTSLNISINKEVHLTRSRWYVWTFGPRNLLPRVEFRRIYLHNLMEDVRLILRRYQLLPSPQ
mgnify:CR=1 FL=1